jgi:hypothetical protein
MMLSAGLAACFGFAALAGHGGGSNAASAVERTQASGNQIALAAETEHGRAESDKIVTRSLQAREAIEAPAKPKQETPAAPTPPKQVAPVAGLTQLQMNNAKKIVDTAKRMGLGKDAQTIAIATALQESQLYNLASTVYAESYDYTDEGEGSDHDSVGLFQQRPQSGWGTVKNLMRPEYAAEQFLKALIQVPGWQQMELTYAAQAVQVSAFPEAYAKHESRATEIVNAFN